jgi:N-acetylneuraminic acid mutarotase
MKILTRSIGIFFALSMLLACGKEPGQKAADVDTSIYGRLLSGRTNHTAVWTGSKMIVYGGFTRSNGAAQSGQFYGDFSTQNDVIGYDPASDSWSLIKTAGTAITGHSAVWTGTEMIVWGGLTSNPTATNSTGTSFVTNAGTRYNPSTNVWSGVSTTNAPSARQGHIAVWAPVSGQTGTASSVMIVWGGTTDTTSLNFFNLNNYVTTGSRYDPASDTWSALPSANAPSVRAAYASAWTGQELLIWGGLAQNGSVDLDTGARYNLQNNVWSAMSVTNAPSSRHSPLAVWTGTKMIILGGQKISQGGPSTQLGDGASYDPQTDTWTSITGFPGFNSSSVDSTSMWAGVWTGVELIAWIESSPVQYAGRYNPTTNSWRTFTLQVASSSSSYEFQRYSATTVWDGTDMIIWGGWEFANNNNGNVQDTATYNTGFRYSPAADTTSRTSIFIK